MLFDNEDHGDGMLIRYGRVEKKNSSQNQKYSAEQCWSSCCGFAVVVIDQTEPESSPQREQGSDDKNVRELENSQHATLSSEHL